MKNRIAAALLIVTSAVCLADLDLDTDTPITIRTLDGQTFENAVVEGVHPGGIDIGYVNPHGDYVLKGLSFKILPEDIRKQYGYDSAQTAQFDAQVKAHEKDDPGKVVEAEKDRLERITREIKAKFSGQNIKIKPDDLRFVIYAKRVSVILSPVSTSLTGCVAKIVEVESGNPISAQFIQIDAAALPAGVNWSGFIYPTGLKTRYQGNEIPVYAESLDRAVVLANHYLEIYSEYAAEGAGQPQTGTAVPPDQALAQQAPQQTDETPPGQAPAQPQQAPTQPQQVQTEQPVYVTDGGYYPGYGGYYPGYTYAYGPGYIGGGFYYIGFNYQPVYWWYRRHYPYDHGKKRYYNPRSPNRRPPDRPRPAPGVAPRPSGGPRPGAPAQSPSVPGGRPQGGPYAPGSGNFYIQSGSGRSYYQGTIQTPTHNIQRSGNFRRAVPVNRGGEGMSRGSEGGVRGGEGMSRGSEGGVRGGEGMPRGSEGGVRGGEGMPRGSEGGGRGGRR